MNTHPGNPSEQAIQAWDQHLGEELNNVERRYTFDMDETPEHEHLKRFARLADALHFIEKELNPLYDAANAAALKHQATHRRLAKVAILSGGFAVCLAIIQLALKAIAPHGPNDLGGLPERLEVAAVLAGVIAVCVGLWAKYNHQWFVQRHVAERLRMLKFQALGRAEFWCGDTGIWKQWVREQIAKIVAIRSIGAVKDWANGGEAEPFEPEPPACVESAGETRATAIYYRRKRLDFQTGYFRTQSRKFHRQTGWMHHVGVPIFFTTILAVFAHFAAEHWGKSTPWEPAGIWALALAALLPVIGFGFRAWTGAFEHGRSAQLFEAKARGLSRISTQLRNDEGDFARTMHHIAHVEHFLEHEHREWLRLLMDAEWFL
jgi:hypothetical protein